jgi:hypothetical protein
MKTEYVVNGFYEIVSLFEMMTQVRLNEFSVPVTRI